MSDDEKMTLDERYKYLRKMQKRYQKAGKKEKSGLLDEMEEITGLHRKSLLRLMKGVDCPSVTLSTEPTIAAR